MLIVFGDEASDETRRRVFVVAGVIGTEELWARLQDEWLSRTNGVPFHATDCDSNRGSYASTPNEQNKALYRDLTIMLAESGLGGWSAAIDLNAQKKVFPDAPDITYYKCFLEVLEAMKNCAVNNVDNVKFTFDARRESDHNAGMLYRIARDSTEWKKQMFCDVSFESSTDQPCLQAADLFAREAMKAVDNRLGTPERPPRKSWLALSATGRFHVDVFSDEWFEDLKRQIPNMENHMGMTRNGYLRWLAEKGRQHNMSNLIIYMEWTGKHGKR